MANSALSRSVLRSASRGMVIIRNFSPRSCRMLAVLFFVGIVYGQGSGALCYDYDGSVLPKDTPCRPHSKHSFCCGPYWTCLENGICADQNTSSLTVKRQESILIRGSCTDKTWSVPQSSFTFIFDSQNQKHLTIHRRTALHDR